MRKKLLFLTLLICLSGCSNITNIETTSSISESVELDNDGLDSILLFPEGQKEMIDNSIGELVFVNIGDNEEEINKIKEAYNKTSKLKGIALSSSNNELLSALRYDDSMIDYISMDNCYTHLDLVDGKWSGMTYLYQEQDGSELSYNFKYDSGFDYLLKPDRRVFQFNEVESLESGDSIYNLSYTTVDNVMGEIKFYISNDGYIKKIETNSEILRIYPYDASVEDYQNSLLLFYQLCSSIDNSSCIAILNEEVTNFRNIYPGELSILNKDIYLEESSLLLNAYKDASESNLIIEVQEFNKEDSSDLMINNSDLSYQIISSPVDFWKLYLIEPAYFLYGSLSDNHWSIVSYYVENESNYLTTLDGYDSGFDFILSPNMHYFNIIDYKEEDIGNKKIVVESRELLGEADKIMFNLDSNNKIKAISITSENTVSFYYISYANNDEEFESMKDFVLSNTSVVDNLDLLNLKN